MIRDQFIGRAFWITLLLIAGTHLVAFFLRGTVLESWLLLVLGICVLVLAWKDLRLGLFIAFAELFVGGHGHLLHADFDELPTISLRMAIFGAVMLAWGSQWLVKKQRIHWHQWRDWPWALLLLVIVLASIQGVLLQSPGAAFDDANGYLFIAYLLPIISLAWPSSAKQKALQVFGASVGWMAGFTLLLSYLFTHLPGKALAYLYTFVRDARLAEVTLQVLDNGSYFYRIFMQSQFFLVIGLFLVLAFLWTKKRAIHWQEYILLAVLGAGAWLSLSRSFLVGFGLGMLFLIFFAWKTQKTWKQWLARGVMLAMSLLLAIAVAGLTVIMPLPPRPDLSEASFYQTSAETGREAGVSSRWQLLNPMMEAIYARPVLGSGFGTEVTYTTDDPRIIEESGGTYTTYRFEWGYQDIWLKMGLPGLIAFLLLFAAYWRALKSSNREKTWLAAGFASGIIFLYVAHIFSPYLNHPIGIGYLLFMIPFLTWNKPMQFETVLKKMPLSSPKPATSIASSTIK